MEPASFATSLGDPRVLAGALTDANLRVLAYDGDTVVGVAAHEPLFGRQADAVIAVAEPSPGAIVSFLLDGLLELAAGRGFTLLRFRFSAPGQRSLATGLTAGRSACNLRSDRLEIRTELSSSFVVERVGPGRGRTAPVGDETTLRRQDSFAA